MIESEFNLDFADTKIAFANKTDQELKETYWLFRMMNNPLFVNAGSKLGLLSLKLGLPFSKQIIRKTIFRQFCGGESLLDSQNTINRLQDKNVLTILDYGVEGITLESEMDAVLEEFLHAVDFAATHDTVPVVSLKLTALASNTLLMKAQKYDKLTASEYEAFERVVERVDTICKKAYTMGVKVFIDAEESWMQDAINRIVNSMMKKYNHNGVVVYNTFQMYRTDQLQYLKDSYEQAQQEGFYLGAKLVRGAYMEKERERAEKQGYPSPIHPNKDATDTSYNEGIKFCIEHYKDIALCNASHNAYSNRLQAEIMVERGIPRDHPHLNFSQLYGMSDNITFNLASEGFNAAKYVVYGQIKQVIHYLVRRAEENTSITGDLSRELKLLKEEMSRRGLS